MGFRDPAVFRQMCMLLFYNVLFIYSLCTLCGSFIAGYANLPKASPYKGKFWKLEEKSKIVPLPIFVYYHFFMTVIVIVIVTVICDCDYYYYFHFFRNCPELQIARLDFLNLVLKYIFYSYSFRLIFFIWRNSLYIFMGQAMAERQGGSDNMSAGARYLCLRMLSNKNVSSFHI